MKELLAIQQKLIPDLLQEMKRRYRILQQINLAQPIGRRSLAQSLGTTERILRTEVDFLKEQGLIFAEATGMSLTDAGKQVLYSLDEVIREIEGFKDLEQRLSKLLKVSCVIIVPGDSQTDPLVKREMGYVAGQVIKERLQDGVIAVTGGTTVAMIAQMLPKVQSGFQIEVLPARGGVGENVEVQANTIAALFANKLGGTYRMLHVPDNISEEAYHLLLEEPYTQEYITRIQKTRMLIHGIGQAITMASRRGASADVVSLLEEKGAKGEALGYYFAADGQVVHAMNSIGLRMNDLERVETIMAVAGGADKAEAVLAVARGSRQDVLVTDEACAEAILKMTRADDLT
ncbi:sugar-binding transcriptional regulator [Effusibacillus lacus]|uniref:Central glycolytic genes regulator n=1 Tax=Effusibacillus lacus TaxID=1348429 RepID=A0A292YLG0_9BACL|nr:sugar-binding domain-containing protein [Effusibacillus lacus]TCS74225.1 central glycolytic genes regulator [Effusibacillus lacus]GAX90778.1 central glycolytic genes regulator [Effusibacillus lacus]